MNIFKKIWKSIRLKPKWVERNKKFEERFPEFAEREKQSVYGYNKVGDLNRWFIKLHFGFKYKIFVPLLWLVKGFLGKKLDEPIETGFRKVKDTIIDYDEFNKNLLIFDRSINKSVDAWIKKYLSVMHGKDPEKFNKCDSVELLLTMKKLIILMARNDTVYRELLNIMMHTITQEMLNEYKGQNVKHYFYGLKNAYDIRYFMIMEGIRHGKKESGSGQSSGTRS